MKILIVSTHYSHPTDAGNRAAIMGQVHTLLQMGNEVHFLFADMSLKKGDFSAMKDYWKENLHIYSQSKIFKLYRLFIDFWRKKYCNGYWKCDDHYPSGLELYAEKLHKTHQFDAVIIQYMRLSKLLTHISIPKKAIYTHDVFAYKDIRTGGAFYETCNAHEEAKAMQRCPFIFAIQEEECSYFNLLSPRSKVLTVYSNYDFHDQPVSHSKKILYLASRMTFNVNGINTFLKDVWPTICEKEPEAELIIGGTVCEKIDGKKYQNVKLLGRVDSLDEYYSHGDIVINPVFQGTGLKIKTFEALSYGKTTIVHPHSTTGIFKKDQAPLLVAETKDQWISLLLDALQAKIDPSTSKKAAMKYIAEMNQFIQRQYNSFLLS